MAWRCHHLIGSTKKHNQNTVLIKFNSGAVPKYGLKVSLDCKLKNKTKKDVKKTCLLSSIIYNQFQSAWSKFGFLILPTLEAKNVGAGSRLNLNGGFFYKLSNEANLNSKKTCHHIKNIKYSIFSLIGKTQKGEKKAFLKVHA